MTQPSHSLEGLITEIRDFPSPEVRIAGLRSVLPLLEAQIESVRLSEAMQLRRKHLQEDTHPEDAAIDVHELKTHLLHTLPQVVRGGFVLAAWSALEACTKDMAHFASAYLRKSLPNKIWEGSFVKATDRAFATLAIPAFASAADRVAMKRLADVRAALIHHNAEVSRLPEDLRRGRHALEAEGLYEEADLHHRYFVPTHHYLERTLLLVANHLEGMRDRVYEATYGTSRGDG